MKINMEKDLHELLIEEQNLFSVYLRELAEQQKHLIENDLDGLKDSIREINQLAQKFMSLEKIRKETVKRILEESQIGKNDINLNNLMARFKGRNLEELERLRNTILDTHVKATVQKERNKRLIKQSMNIIRQSVNHPDENDNPRGGRGVPVPQAECLDEKMGC
jgi:hypothetical protein